MGSGVDPIGELLSRAGILGEGAVGDVLQRQQRPIPFASLCYVLGYADEETLVRVLSGQMKMPAVVLDRSVLRVRLSGGAAREVLTSNRLLCVDEDEGHLYIATDNPTDMKTVFQELEFMKGKIVVPYVALQITLERTLRDVLRTLDAGAELHHGPQADPSAASAYMHVVSEVATIAPETPAGMAYQIVFSDVTSEVRNDDLVLIDTLTPDASPDEANVRAPTLSEPPSDEEEGSVFETKPGGGPPIEVIDLDEAYETEGGSDATSVEEKDRAGKKYILIVDEDLAHQQKLAACFHADDFMISTAMSGVEAIRILHSDPPDAAVIDVMLPEVSGLQLCRSIKQSQRYRHIPVVLMSEVVDSGRVTDEMLRQHGADGYFEKPVNPDRIRRRVRELFGSADHALGGSQDDGFDRALELYRAGNLDDAVVALRQGLELDPLSAKHHFVLANLLQKQAQIYEAIDEYEATIDLKPNYFPALTRLAYLYYKQGFAAKAIETWRRALPHCPDPALRENIEVFMRKLIADMQSTAPR